MAEKAELEALARRYLDLWQDQMSALAGDPEFAETMNRLSVSLGAAGAWPQAAWPAFMAGFAPPGATGREAGTDGAETASGSAAGGAGGRATRPGPGPSGTAAAGAASGHGGADLDELAGRLAALERRVAALESAAREKGDGASGKPRKGGS